MAFQRPTRYVRNPFPDYASFLAKQRSTHGDGKVLAYTSTPAHTHQVQKMREWLTNSLETIEKRWPPDCPVVPSSDPGRHDRDSSVYVGAAGNAYLHWKLSRWWDAEGRGDKADEHVLKALQAIETALSLIKDPSGIAFYIGAAGSGICWSQLLPSDRYKHTHTHTHSLSLNIYLSHPPSLHSVPRSPHPCCHSLPALPRNCQSGAPSSCCTFPSPWCPQGRCPR